MNPLLILSILMCGLLMLTPASGQAGSVEERRILTELQEQRRALQERDKKLDQREIELKTLQAEVDKKLDELRQWREELAGMLAQKDAAEIAKAQELSKMYERMDPASAARIITTLDKDLAVAILEGMRAKSAGRILATMDYEVASQLTISYSSLEQ
ncbi:MgtE intracellular N domain-containing protein [Geoalkalibacter ferrihydriticus]|uniref:Magnesium transporter MgtE intracellular domain-containing protein n=2 Tax=Geoalkalibacter ferrihydriticus TaxID=392333 RepID=A0A0C2HRW5_9BACT|nr:hypothetical protein [Geoalkalibacter ferrihydriticus]KIH77565.1 hypothetical protein GFER_02440 [Geoalkalibacter ferrihydriticus DSM 17813]SDL68370.1 MgtE intracellular N domain-containing protein [Geoalkalibacter ferrihydriticus]